MEDYAKAIAELEDQLNRAITVMRLEAENERLKIELAAMRGAANSYKTEVKRLEEESQRFADIGKMYREIKAEAVREFAKKTDEMITEIYNNHIFGNNDLGAEEKDAIINFSADVASGFDNLIKEMEK